MQKWLKIIAGTQLALVVVLLLGAAVPAPILAGIKFWEEDNKKSRAVSDQFPMPVRQGLTWQDTLNDTIVACPTDDQLGSSAAKQIIIKTDDDALNTLWCRHAAGVDADVGFQVGTGGAANIVETNTNANEVFCCGEGGTVIISVQVYNDNST